MKEGFAESRSWMLHPLATARGSVPDWRRESTTGLKRHYNTELESRELRQALGETIEGTEGYTGVTEE